MKGRRIFFCLSLPQNDMACSIYFLQRKYDSMTPNKIKIQERKEKKRKRNAEAKKSFDEAFEKYGDLVFKIRKGENITAHDEIQWKKLKAEHPKFQNENFLWKVYKRKLEENWIDRSSSIGWLDRSPSFEIYEPRVVQRIIFGPKDILYHSFIEFNKAVKQ